MPCCKGAPVRPPFYGHTLDCQSCFRTELFPQRKTAAGSKPGVLARLFFGEIPIMVARSLREDPETWTTDITPRKRPYTLTHISGLRVWVANKSYGVHVEYQNTQFWGDVSWLSCFRLSPGHHYLWAAAKDWIRDNTPRYASPSETVQNLLDASK